jgi:hypothetical protein
MDECIENACISKVFFHYGIYRYHLPGKMLSYPWNLLELAVTYDLGAIRENEIPRMGLAYGGSMLALRIEKWRC